MSIFPWIFLGLIAGYITSKVVNEPGESVFLDIGLVIAGAVYGGVFFTWMGAAGVTGFNAYNMCVEVAGVVFVLVVCQAMFGRRTSVPSAPDRRDDRSSFTTVRRTAAPSASPR